MYGGIWDITQRNYEQKQKVQMKDNKKWNTNGSIKNCADIKTSGIKEIFIRIQE